MKYQINFEHDDFVLLLDVLRKSEEAGVIDWSATDFVCQNTSIIY